MRKKTAALVLCALLILQLAAPPARAADEVYFIAAEENILPLSGATMPVWYNGYLYIPGSIFTGSTRKSLGVSYYCSTDSQNMILYSGNDRTLYFDVNKSYVTDVSGAVYYPGAIQRNGRVFVPAAMVADFFGLQYSVTKVSRGYLVWLRKPGFGLSDKNFADAASRAMAERYNDYLKELETAQVPAVPEDTGSAGTEIQGKGIFLCMEAGDQTSAILDALDRYGAQAAFFCTVDFLREQGDLLRRMAVTGQTVGILADASDPGRTVTEQLEEGNRALALATCGKTRLALIRGGNDQALQAARDAGYCCVTPDIDRTDYELQSSSNAASLLKRVSAYRGDVSVWLGNTADAAGLRAFLSAAEDADGRCLALTETA